MKLKLSRLVLSLILGLVSLNSFSQSLTEQLRAKREESSKKTPKEIKEIMQKGVEQVRNLGLHKSALGVGKKAPPVNFQDLNKKRVSLAELYQDKLTVLTFYRGGWCPYCMLELDAYNRDYKKFEKLGAQVVAVSPDQIKEAAKTKEKRKLVFKVLSDPSNNAAKLFGLAFKVDKETLAIYKKFGINLKASQGNSDNELPLPGTYVIDKRGIIRYSFVDPDYTKRADPLEVLKVLKGL